MKPFQALFWVSMEGGVSIPPKEFARLSKPFVKSALLNSAKQYATGKPTHFQDASALFLSVDVDKKDFLSGKECQSIRYTIFKKLKVEETDKLPHMSEEEQFLCLMTPRDKCGLMLSEVKTDGGRSPVSESSLIRKYIRGSIDTLIDDSVPQWAFLRAILGHKPSAKNVVDYFRRTDVKLARQLNFKFK